MRSFRSYLNRTRIFTVTTMTALGCVSTSTKYEVDALTPFLSVSPISTPTKALVGKDTSASDVFKFYCRDGKQIKALTKTIKGVISASPPGVPVDQAAKRNKLASEEMRAIAKNYFLAQCGGTPWNGGSALIAARRFHSPKDYVAHFKGPTTIPLRVTLKNPAMLVDFENAAEPSILGHIHVGDGSAFTWEQRKTIAGGLRSEGEIVSKIRPNALVPTNSFECSLGYAFMGIQSTTPLQAYDVRGSDRKPTTIYPLRPAAQLETTLFRQTYTMLIPSDVQSRIFGNVLRQEVAGVPDYGDAIDLFFVKRDGSFDLSAAADAHNRERLWNTYIKSMTTLKESETDDPQVVMYQVGLDLAPFCAYGRPVADLMTK